MARPNKIVQPEDLPVRSSGRALRSVGANFPDVVETTTFTTDVDEYHRVADERFKFCAWTNTEGAES